MRKPTSLLLALAVCASTFFIVRPYFRNQPHEQEQFRDNEEGEREEEEEEEQSGAARQLNTWFQTKGYPDASNMTGKYMNAWYEFQEIKKRTAGPQTRINVSNWTSLGQCFDGGTRIGGRIVCMAIDPSNTNNLWVGSASGGMWRSTNAGTSWTYVETNLPVLGVSSIIIHPTNPQIIYAGTGEVYNTEFTNAGGYNVWKTRGTFGIGVIKSINGGATWTQVLTKNESELFGVQSMAFQPGNPSTVFACATDGLHRSFDDGATWTRIYTANNVRDIAIHPTNVSIMVLSIGNMTNATKGIYRTTNGTSGTPTWTQITSAAGLPATYQGHIKLDHSGPNMLVASIGRDASLQNEIYRSTNFGQTWTVQGTTGHCSYQFWFAHTVGVNPFFTDSIIYGGVNIYRSGTGARSAIGGLHADHHDVKFDPVRRGTVYVCNDGGVYKTTNGGANWSAINTGLNATQFYASLGVSRQDANFMVGGLQDNGQTIYNGTNWQNMSWGGGDGTSCAVHPTNDNIIMASRDAKQIFRSTNGGGSGSAVTSYWGFSGDSRTGFVAPIAFAPSNGNIAYLASDNIHISTNAGGSFTNNALGSTPPYPATTPNAFIEQRHKTAIALAVAPTDQNRLYVSTSPFAQYDNDVSNIYVTGTPNLLRTSTPATTPYASIKGTLPDRFVTDIAVSRNSIDSVYIVLGGFGTSHVYMSANGGGSWTSIGAGLPNVPFNAILIDPINPRTIYAACDYGVYVSPDRGQTWIDYNTGFWDITMVYDLQVDANNKLIAATHGKGVFRSDLYVHIVTPVNLISFTGLPKDNYNELKWITVEEQNVSHYELERSADGNSYTKIASINARNETTQMTYLYNDHTAPFEAYYRLKMIDNDGTFTYSTIIFIRRPYGNPSFNVMGNPFKSTLILKYKLPRDQQINVRLFNNTGQLLIREDYNATAGIGMYTIEGVDVLAKGIYMLRIECGDTKQTIKVMKE